MTTDVAANAELFRALEGIPKIDFPSHLREAVADGRGMLSVLREVVALRRGAGKLTPNEYFYYRLWERGLSPDDKRRFVGKQAQQPMHVACNHTGWYATAADKLLFQSLMRGLDLPVPELLAVTHPERRAADAPTIAGTLEIARLLREPRNYPLFAKPIDGKYSLAVINAEGLDAEADDMLLRGQGRRPVTEVANEIAGHAAGYLIQRRLTPHPDLAHLFGPALWTVRVIMLITPDGPVLHRAVAKIATGTNPADNFWRQGNLLGAIDLATGDVCRVVGGTGAAMALNPVQPDTGLPILGTRIPDWPRLEGLVRVVALMLPGIRTQSWDVALTDRGPVLLEVNFGGDLNLAQLAHGAGVLDDTYAAHVRRCGYPI